MPDFVNFTEIESKFDNAILKAGLVDIINQIDMPSISSELLYEIMEQPMELSINDKGELFCNGPDGIIILDPKVNNIKDVLEHIPECPFDVECGGKRSMQQEAVAIYKISLINGITSGMLRPEIDAIINNNYDFGALKGIKGDMPFFALLQSVLEDKNSVVEFILTAANFKLTETREKKDISYTGLVSQEDSIKLDSIKRRVAVINYNYSKRIESEEDKYVRLGYMRNADDEIEAVLKEYDERIRLLWRVYKLDVSAVSFIAQRKIRVATNQLVSELRESGVIKNVDDAVKIAKRLRKRGKRQVLSQIKRECYEKFCRGEIEDLIPKL